MKSAEEYARELRPGYEGHLDLADFIRAIQRDALLTVSTGIISMMGAPPWLDNPMGDEILKRIAAILPEVEK